MEKASGGEGGKPATRFGFGFSWADEVEREEREQQQLPLAEQIVLQHQEAKKEQTTRADPFGAARPREVVLAEKGVDWRARDRELDAAATHGPRHVAVPPASTRRSTPAHRAPLDRGSGRTPGPRLHNAESTPRAVDAPPVSRSARGGGKRKCLAEIPAPGTVRRARAVGCQGRRVFSKLNVGEGCASSFRGAAKKGCNLGGSETEGSRAVADGGGSRDCSATATAAAATEEQSAVGQKRRKGRKRGRGGGSKKAENQQALLL